MSAVYFMGVREVESKKSGKTFYPASFLFRNSWGNWVVESKFCSSSSVANDIEENVLVGSAVVCTLGMGGELVSCVPDDTIPMLELVD